VIFDSHVAQLRSLPDQIQSRVEQQPELFFFVFFFFFSFLCYVSLVAFAREPADGRSRSTTIIVVPGPVAPQVPAVQNRRSCAAVRRAVRPA
jgi:hypothetical protein